MDAYRIGKMQFKLPCHLNMDYGVQFVKNYNRNTKQTKIISNDGQEKIITLRIDVVQNAFTLDVVAKPYVDLKNCEIS